MSKGKNRNLDTPQAAGLIFTLPFIIGFVLFTMIPMGMSLYYSFCDYDILGTAKLSGFANYAKLLSNDRIFNIAVRNTVKFALLSVPLKLVFALLIALILVKTSKMTAIYRAMYYVPSLLGGSVAIAVLWRRLFATNGVLNAILVALGFSGYQSFSWLGKPAIAMNVITILPIWQFGSSMLIFVSALKQIPNSLYEAARVDGARKMSAFFRITLPLLTPTMFFNLVMQMISGFLVFTQVAVITNGEPVNQTMVLALYMYRQTFIYNKAGYGSAIAWITLLLISAITLILFATKRLWVCEDQY